MTASQHPERTSWLDGWRGIAILLVLLEHFAKIGTGRIGVEIFFVLSGLLMGQLLFVKRIPLPTFYRRRIARTMPVFYLYLAVMVVLGLFLGAEFRWTDVAASAVFVRSYVGDHIWLDPLALGHTWSLNVEEHAYLLLSVVALFVGRKSERAARWCLTAFAVLSLSSFAYFRLFPLAGGTPSALRTECAIFPLIASAAMFLWVRAYQFRLSPAGFMVLLVATLSLAVVDYIGIPRGGLLLQNFAMPLALAAVVNQLHCAPQWLRDLLSAKWLTWFGLCSYSLYLWNYPFFYLMNHGKWHLGVAAAAFCSVAVAVASFYWFEKPMRAWLRGDRPKSATVAPTHAIATDEAK